MSIAIAPSAKYAYVGNNQDGTVSQYTIGADGALAPMTPASVTTVTGASPISVAIDPLGTYAYVVNELAGNYGNLVWFTIGTSGALSSPSAPYSLGTYYLSSIAIHPSGKYAYVTT
jgi:6-phosphogluconolactonase (cycloisomerase 2 family)